MLRFGLWLWKRISDWYTTLDLLEAFGWKAACAAMLAGGTAGFLTFWNDAPGHTVFLAFLGSGLLVLGFVHLWHACHVQKITVSTHPLEAKVKPSPLKIEFPDECSCSAFIKEPAKIGQDMVSRNIVWVNIQNSSEYDVRNVRGEIRSFVAPNSDAPEDIKGVFANKIVALRFQEDKTVLDFSPHMSARLYMISYAQHFLSGFLRIEGVDQDAHENQFLHSSDVWTFKIRVTADGFLPVQREFTALVNEGSLQVKACDWEVM